MSAWILDSFPAIAARALPEHALARTVAHQLLENVRAAHRTGQRAYFTICNLVGRRGKQHRNATRIIIRKLAAMGIITVTPLMRVGRFAHAKFSVNFGALRRYKPSLRTPVEGRTHADYEAEQIEHARRVEEARRRRQEREQAAFDARDVMTPEQLRAAARAARPPALGLGPSAAPLASLSPEALQARKSAFLADIRNA